MANEQQTATHQTRTCAPNGAPLYLQDWIRPDSTADKVLTNRQQQGKIHKNSKKTSSKQRRLLSTWRPKEGATYLPFLPPARCLILVCEETHLPAEAARTPSGSTPAADSQGFSLGSCDPCATEYRAMCGAQRLQSSLHAPTRPAPGRATRHLRGVQDLGSSGE